VSDDDFDFFDPMNPPKTTRSIGESFLLTLKEKETFLRFMSPLPREGQSGMKSHYVGVKYHWDVDAHRSYPCFEKSAPNGECMGCASDNPETRRQKIRVIAPAIDKDGNIRVWNLPAKLFTLIIKTAAEVIPDDAEITDYTAKIVSDKSDGGGPPNYMVFLKLQPDSAESDQVTRANVGEAIRNEYLRALQTIHPELAGTYLDEDEVIEEASVPDAALVTKAVGNRKRRPAKATQ